MQIELIQETSIESMKFVRLPRTLKDAVKALEAGEGETRGYLALELAHLTNKEYDDFTADFRQATEWLDGTGGWSSTDNESEFESEEWYRGAYHLVVKIVSENRRTLYVDAQGQDRPIYVGVGENPS